MLARPNSTTRSEPRAPVAGNRLAALREPGTVTDPGLRALAEAVAHMPMAVSVIHASGVLLGESDGARALRDTGGESSAAELAARAITKCVDVCADRAHQRPDGERRRLRYTCSPIRDRSGGCMAAVVVAVEVPGWKPCTEQDGSIDEKEATARRSLTTLTERELEILQLIADGLDSQAIAARLHISERTERNHVANVLTKLDVHSRLQAVIFCLRYGAVELR